MLACTTSEVTLSRWDCSITLDISTAESADSRVRNLAFAAEIGAGDDEDASDNDDVGDRSGKSEGSGAVSLLHLAGGVRASHGIVQGRGCFEVYIKALVDENSPAEIIIGASPSASSLIIGADDLGVGLRNDGRIIRDGSVEGNTAEKRDPIVCGFYVTCCIDCTTGELSYFVNGRFTRKTKMPSTFEAGVTAMHPHICLKNCVVDVNFTKFKCKVPSETPLAMLPESHLARSPFQRPSRPEVTLLIGPPSAGKSTFAEQERRAALTPPTTAKSTKSTNNSKCYVISLEKVAELVTIDPQQLALTWKEVVKYYQKVAPSLYELAGKRPYYNYILDDINGNPTHRAKALACFPPSIFSRLGVVVMPECAQLLQYHSKRKDVWQRRYLCQESVDHLIADIQLPQAGEFEQVSYIGQDTQEKVEEALSVYVEKAQNRVSHYMDEQNGVEETIDDEQPIALTVATFTPQGDQNDKESETEEQDPERQVHENPANNNTDAKADSEAANVESGSSCGNGDDEKSADDDSSLPASATPIVGNDLTYLQSLAAQCSTVSSRWSSLRRSRSDPSYKRYNVQVMFIVASVDFEKHQGNSQRFIRVTSKPGAQDLGEQDDDLQRDDDDIPEVEFGDDDADVHFDEEIQEEEDRRRSRNGALRMDLSSSNPVKLLLSGAVEQRKANRLGRLAKGSSSSKQRPQEKRSQSAFNTPEKQTRPAAVLGSPENYAFGVSGFAPTSSDPSKRRRQSLPTPSNVTEREADPFSSDDDIPLVSDIARKQREQVRTTSKQRSAPEQQGPVQKPAKANVRYRPGARAESPAGEGTKATFGSTAVSHLGDHEHRVRGRLAVPNGSKAGFPTTRGFVATAKNTPAIPLFQHQKMRAIAEASRAASDELIPTLPEQTTEKKRAYELAWEDVGRRTSKRTLAQRQDMIAPGVPAPLTDT